MKYFVKILSFVLLLLVISSCSKYEPLSPKTSEDSYLQLKSGFSTDVVVDKQITDPENEEDLDVSITDPENEEDKETN